MIKQNLINNLKIALEKIGIKETVVELDHPTNPNFGDYATSIALRLAGQTKKGNFLDNIKWIIRNVTKENFESHKISLPVGKLTKEVKEIIKAKTDLVYLKPRIYAKIVGWWKHLKGHKEISPTHFFLLPFFINQPQEIYQDKSYKNRFDFIFNFGHLGIILIEIVEESKINEIVTIFYIKEKQVKNLRKIFENKKKAFGAGTATPRFWPSDIKSELPAAEFSGLHQKVQQYLNTILKSSQEDILSYEEKKSPLEVAKDIVKNLPKNNTIEKVEVIKPGFINFWLSKDFLLLNLKKINEDKIVFPRFHLGKNKKVMIEFAQPNTHKLFHIGHLRNISIGESLARILEAVGNKVIRTNYQGDVGLHIAKCLWAIQNSKFETEKLKTLKEKIEFIGRMYTEGTRKYEEDKKAKEEILKINEMIYNQEEKILPLWQQTRQWSLQYFDQIYQRVDTHFNRLYFESEMAKRALEICQKLLKEGILEKSQGAVVFNGKKYGLDTRVFINSQGFPTYEGKELSLAEKEFSEFGEIDKCIHVVTPEQTSFFKVTFKVEELIDPKKYQGKQYHLAYEWVKLKTEKMSSREGNVIETNWLLDEVKKRIKEKFKSQEEVAETLAVAAVKYSFLKSSVQNQIAFDFDESISLEGNSGPYLLYTYVRTQSVIKKSQISNLKSQINILNPKSEIEVEEFCLLRTLYQFPEVVEKAAKNFAPNYIANYLYDLGQKFNLFYQKYPIIKTPPLTKNLRLAITKATGEIIKKGLYLLGVNIVERM